MSVATRLLVLSVSVALSACVINGGGGDTSASLDLRLTFEGLGCQSAHAEQVKVTFVDGAYTDVNYTCTSDSPVLITIPNVDAGTYRLRIDAFDQSALAYTGTFDASTSGDNIIDVKSATEVVAKFLFAGVPNVPGLSCEEAGVTNVVVTAQGLEWATDCPAAGGEKSLKAFPVGTYDIKVEGFGAGDVKLYAATYPGVSIGAGSQRLTFDTPGFVKGGLEFSWTFPGGSGCGEVYSLEYVLRDAEGHAVGVEPSVVPCADAKETLTNLDAGRYSLISVDAKAINGTVLSRLTSQGVWVPAGRTQAFVLTFQ